MADELATFKGGLEPNDESVSLTIPRRHFGDFIQGLLGEPRRIERKYPFRCGIDLNDLSHLDSIVMQRITQQHQARLIDFQAKIYFCNRTRKTLPSREAFLSFGDNSPHHTIGVSLVWIFLIQFPHAKIPERQAIRFRAFCVSPDDNRLALEYRTELEDYVKVRLGAGEIDIEIEHTEVTWGDDIFAHIDNQIKLWNPAPSITERTVWWIRKILNSGYTVVLYFIAVFFVLTIDWKRHYSVGARQLKDKVSEFSSISDPLAQLTTKMDYYFQEAIGNAESYFFVIVFETGIFVLLYVLAVQLADKMHDYARRRAFVVLNLATKNLREGYEQRRRTLIHAIGLAFVVNVLAALFLNPLTPFFFSIFDRAILSFF